MPSRRLVALSSPALLACLAVIAGAPPALAQQRGSDVGGQPTKRKLTKMPRLVRFVEAEYPAAKKQSGVSASVVLTIEIGATGKVTNVTVAESAGPDFDAAAAAAARWLASRGGRRQACACEDHLPLRLRHGAARTGATSARPSRVRPAEPPAPAGTTRAARAETAAPAATRAARVEQRRAARRPLAWSDDRQRHRRGGGDRAGPRTRREVVDYAVRAEQARKVPGRRATSWKVVQNLPGVSRPPRRVRADRRLGLSAEGHARLRRRRRRPSSTTAAASMGRSARPRLEHRPRAGRVRRGSTGAGSAGSSAIETRTTPHAGHTGTPPPTRSMARRSSRPGRRARRIRTRLRYSRLDRVLAAASAPDVGDFFPDPHTGAQLKATVDLRKRESVDAVFRSSRTTSSNRHGLPDPAKRRVRRRSGWRATRGTRASRTTATARSSRRSSGAARARSRITPARRRRASTSRRIATGSERLSDRSWKQARRPRPPRDGQRSGPRRKGVERGLITTPAARGRHRRLRSAAGRQYAVDRWKTHILDVGPHAHADVRFGPVTDAGRPRRRLRHRGKQAPSSGRQRPAVGFSRMGRPWRRARRRAGT
ncbi:MAG: TonB family protein [Labilithrix sp.]|nr:TonB family protein [Labilithrix sp.]